MSGDSSKRKKESDIEIESSPFFYSVTAQPATTVDKSVVGHFTSPSETNLILAFVIITRHHFLLFYITAFLFTIVLHIYIVKDHKLNYIILHQKV